MATHTVYVGNLDYELTENELRDMLDQVGVVERAGGLNWN